MSNPEVRAVDTELHPAPGASVPGDVIAVWELDNGRRLVMDDGGILDASDVDLTHPLPPQRFHYVSWDELLTLLDSMRAERMAEHDA